jgi:UDP-N-acetyl-D-mannosaminuronic acid dehydrogenase
VFKTLQQQIESRSAPLAVIGLGYVGLPVACLFAKSGFQVIGVDLNAERVGEINAGISPIKGIEPGLNELVSDVVRKGSLRATTTYQELTSARIILIAVDTPVESETHQPLFRSLKSALTDLGHVLQPGTLIIVESTIAPGTMSQIVEPVLAETSGLKSGVDFWLGHCPERVMPGRLIHNLCAMDRVVGGQTAQVAHLMMTLYRAYVEGALDPTDLLTAELVKTGENAYRDVNIAFANEMALICEAAGGDVWAVRTLLNKSPGRNMLLPGAGVGGHCIPKDPWLLVYGAANRMRPALIPSARAVNEGMPGHIVELIEDVIRETGNDIHGSRIAVLGYSYLENSDDTRHTPTASLVEKLMPLGCEIVIHDPFVPQYQKDIWDVLRGTDCVVVMVAHQAYKTLDLNAISKMMHKAALVDGRSVFATDDLRKAGFHYRLLGLAKHSQAQ